MTDCKFCNKKSSVNPYCCDELLADFIDRYMRATESFYRDLLTFNNKGVKNDARRTIEIE